jgi:hypothetical protein
MEHNGVNGRSQIHTFVTSFANIRFSLTFLFKTLYQVVSYLENSLTNLICTSNLIHATYYLLCTVYEILIMLKFPVLSFSCSSLDTIFWNAQSSTRVLIVYNKSNNNNNRNKCKRNHFYIYYSLEYLRNAYKILGRESEGNIPRWAYT